jgi:hypothetical protein
MSAVVSIDALWWRSARLRTTLTEPRRHELIVDGHTVTLLAGDFLSVHKFTTRYLDAIGSFPVFPPEKQARFLRDISEYWFANREEVEEVEEASEAGSLRADIRDALRSSPVTEQAGDLDRGAVLDRGPTGALFAVSPLHHRCRRHALVTFTPAQFYSALRELGCKPQGQLRIDNVRVSAWLAPRAVMADE